MRDRQISIPLELWYDIIRYHIMDQRDNEIDCRIQNGIESKIDRQVRHQSYTQYKTAPTAAEREQAREKYLDSIGLPDDYRY